MPRQDLIEPSMYGLVKITVPNEKAVYESSVADFRKNFLPLLKKLEEWRQESSSSSRHIYNRA